MDFWAGLFVGWVIGSVGTGLGIMFFAGAGRNKDDWPDDDPIERLKGRRE